MKGKHHIVIESPRLKYEFDIKRNLTLIQGDSATGKTTLIDLIRDYQGGSAVSPVRIESDVPCEVFSDTSARWRQSLELIHDSIIFIDEENHFIRTKEFAEVVNGNSNYFVLITRESLPELPYSVCEIYGIRTSGKYHYPEQVYHEFYRIYEEEDINCYMQGADRGVRIITEDSRSGFQFFSEVCGGSERCVSAGGNSNIYRVLRAQNNTDIVALICDGAAFGAHIQMVLEYCMARGNSMLYLPESFEWIILKSGVVDDPKIIDVLEKTEEYIDSKDYSSWEQFYTDYLVRITSGDSVMRYQKGKLGDYYLLGKNKKRILDVLPQELQKICAVAAHNHQDGME